MKYLPWILLSIILIGNIIIAFWKTKKRKELENMIHTLEYILGEEDINEEDVVQKYENADLILRVLPDDKNEKWQMVDTSLYMKNGEITLTDFVPKQEFKEIIEDTADTAFLLVAQEVGEDYKLEENDLLTMQEEIAKRFIVGTRKKNIRVYQLESGQWIWRE